MRPGSFDKPVGGHRPDGFPRTHDRRTQHCLWCFGFAAGVRGTLWMSVAAKKGTKMADHFDEIFRDFIPASQDGVKAKPFRSLHEP